MERRQFVKTGCTACLLAAIAVSFPSIPGFALKRAKPFKVKLNENNQAEVPLALFAETNLQVIRVKGAFYDIALHKDEACGFTAFLMRCTHMDNQLQLTGDGFRCSLHGSEYDKQGQVTKGPAEMPLMTYTTELTETTILINIPKNEE